MVLRAQTHLTRLHALAAERGEDRRRRLPPAHCVAEAGDVLLFRAAHCRAPALVLHALAHFLVVLVQLGTDVVLLAVPLAPGIRKNVHGFLLLEISAACIQC